MQAERYVPERRQQRLPSLAIVNRRHHYSTKLRLGFYALLVLLRHVLELATLIEHMEFLLNIFIKCVQARMLLTSACTSFHPAVARDP